MWNQARDERAAHLLAGRLRACSSGGGGARLELLIAKKAEVNARNK